MTISWSVTGAQFRVGAFSWFSCFHCQIETFLLFYSVFLFIVRLGVPIWDFLSSDKSYLVTKVGWSDSGAQFWGLQACFTLSDWNIFFLKIVSLADWDNFNQPWERNGHWMQSLAQCPWSCFYFLAIILQPPSKVAETCARGDDSMSAAAWCKTDSTFSLPQCTMSTMHPSLS